MRLFACLGFGALVLIAAPLAPASALPVTKLDQLNGTNVELIQHSSSREFRRCMRQKYGRNYYRGVKRAHRFHMAQACGG
jgi:hypothetical protein